MRKSIAHPVPYQGSKRKLAPLILAHFPLRSRQIYEPFAGSAAISLAALQSKRVESVHLNDALTPLMRLWQEICENPEEISGGYQSLWMAQATDPRSFYERVRSEFNKDQCPIKLLYLLARCVKSAVRFNARGQFNQSADHRRLGTKPDRMRKSIMGASRLLKGRLTTTAGDYENIIQQATVRDVIYFDPPYQGTSQGKDHRYIKALDRDRFIKNLQRLRERRIPFLVSFDGRCGNKRYGDDLPKDLGLTRLELPAGPSSQATLTGRRAQTIESLYIAPQLLTK